MPRYSRTLHHRVLKGPQFTIDRRSQLRRIIEKCTGISQSMLEVIEYGMNERNKHPLLKNFLTGHTSLPSSQKIIARLLTAPIAKGKNGIPENLFSEYRVSIKSSRGKVEIVANMRLFRDKSIFRLKRSHGVITVRYFIYSNEDVHEYRQDFLLSKKRFVTTKHSALEYRSNIPQQWRSRLAPKLLAPPNTIFL